MNGFLDRDFVGCRLCGATHAEPRQGTIGKVCDSCWDKFARSLGERTRKTTHEFNQWLARQLLLAANRLQKYGTTSRCEAATLQYLDRTKGHHLLSLGHQCKQWATVQRDGRWVCQAHANATEVTLVGSQQHSPCEVLGEALISLARQDQELAAVLIKVSGELSRAR